MKRSRIKTKLRPDDDKVTPEVYAYVMDRDNYTCMARLLDPKADTCRGRWGTMFSGHAHPQYVGFVNEWLTLDHVPDKVGEKKGMSVAGSMKGKRAPSDPKHLLVLCWHHNTGPWASANREVEREYLQKREPTRYPPFEDGYPQPI